MKKILIAVLMYSALVTQYANSQDRKLFYGKRDAGAETFFYFEDDSVYIFSFLSSVFCDLGHSFVCSFNTKDDTIIVEGFGDIIIKKNKLILIECSQSGRCKRTILREVLFYKDEIIKCLAEYGVIFKEGQIYVPEYMNNK